MHEIYTATFTEADRRLSGWIVLDAYGHVMKNPGAQLLATAEGVTVVAPPKPPRIYIAGPMSAYWKQQYNRKAFEEAAANLRKLGFEAIIPHELDDDAGVDLCRPPESFTREERAAMMRRDLAAIDGCDGVFWIDRRTESLGACVEAAYANFTGVPVFFDYADLVIHSWAKGHGANA